MQNFTKRIALVLFASILVLGGLVACGGNDPKNAEEVVSRYTSNANVDNYHSDLTLKYSMAMLGQSMDFNVQMSLDTAGNNAHLTSTIDGLDNLADSEMYLVKDDKTYTQYTCNNPKESNPIWIKTELKDTTFVDNLISSNLLKNGEFAKVGDGYQISVTGKNVLSALASSGVNMSDTLDSLIGSDASSKELLENSRAVYTFDKDCYLTNLTFALDIAGDKSTANTSSNSNSSTSDITLSFAIDINMQISDYGKVDASSVTVPENVIKNAVDASSALNASSSSTTSDNSKSDTADSSSENTGEQTSETADAS